jgi:hypothetical protein
LNEFRFQYAKRDSRNFANGNSGAGPSIVITGVANIGAPENDDTIAPLQVTTQFQNNLTWTLGNHAVKIGGGLNRIDDERKSNVFARYTFPNLAAYLNARNGLLREAIRITSKPSERPKSNTNLLFTISSRRTTGRRRAN